MARFHELVEEIVVCGWFWEKYVTRTNGEREAGEEGVEERA